MVGPGAQARARGRAGGRGDAAGVGSGVGGGRGSRLSAPAAAAAGLRAHGGAPAGAACGFEAGGRPGRVTAAAASRLRAGVGAGVGGLGAGGRGSRGGLARAGAAADAAATPSRVLGRTYLIIVAAFFGSLNVIMRYLYAMPGPPSASVLSVVRNILILFCFVPMFLARTQPGLKDSQSPGFFKAAFEMAVWNLGAQGALNVGLLFTDATRASFLTQTSVVLTPLVSLYAGEKVVRAVWFACMLSLVGVVVLTLSGSPAGVTAVAGGLNLGDFICLTGALCWSIYIFRIGKITRLGFDMSKVQAWKNVFLTLFYLVWLAGDAFQVGLGNVQSLWAGWGSPLAWGLIAASAIFPGIVADLFQAKGQKAVSASESNIIMSSEPLWTALLCLCFLSETMGLMSWIGGGLILVAALLASIAS